MYNTDVIFRVSYWRYLLFFSLFRFTENNYSFVFISNCRCQYTVTVTFKIFWTNSRGVLNYLNWIFFMSVNTCYTNITLLYVCQHVLHQHNITLFYTLINWKCELNYINCFFFFFFSQFWVINSLSATTWTGLSNDGKVFLNPFFLGAS